MSRRIASIPSLTRVVGVITAMILLITLLPGSVSAQRGDDQITPRKIQHEWQLLTQQGPGGRLEDVPAGVGATMLMRSNFVSGDAACSSYDSTYSNSANLLNVFVEDDEVQWRDCDPTSREFDELFYENLAQIASINEAEDVLDVRDAVGDPLMLFTRAQIDNDPTASRWSLARIGDADGSVQPVIRGLFPWMEFLRGGSVVGDSGCGSFLGKYAVNEGRIDITDVDYRLISCADGARTQAERFLATLDDITDFQVRPAGLALEDELGTTRLALTPELDVADKTWTPTAIYDRSGRQTFGQGNKLTTSAVKFIGPFYEGRSICRQFAGEAVRSGLAVSVKQPTFLAKPRPCLRELGDGTRLQDVESAFITALEDAASYALRGEELSLTDVDGVTRAVLEPQPPLTGTTWELFRMRQGKKLVTPRTDDGASITATFEDIDAASVGVLQGQTGVSNANDENEYFGTFKSDRATAIDILQLQPTGRGCRGNLAKTPACRTEAAFLKLLESATSYVARDEDLKVYKGLQNILVFRPQRLADAEE